MTGKRHDSFFSKSSIGSLPRSLQKKVIERWQRAIPWLARPAQIGVIKEKYEWKPRDSQKPPTADWRVWLLLAGRGFGKTRTGAEYVRAAVETGRARRIALVAPTALDARAIMIEGESGLLSVGPSHRRPHYEPSLHRLTWDNGAVATLFSADEPNRLRGPQHDLAWCDELAAWRYPQAWDMLMFGLRLGQDPRCSRHRASAADTHRRRDRSRRDIGRARGRDRHYRRRPRHRGARLCAGRRVRPLRTAGMGPGRDPRLPRAPGRPHRRGGQQWRRDGRDDVAHHRSKCAVRGGACRAWQGGARRAGRRALRAGQGASSRHLRRARRPDVRVQ